MTAAREGTEQPAAQVTLKVNAPRLWAGGTATAIAACLAMLVGLMIASDLFGVDVVEPGLTGPAPETNWIPMILTAGGAALSMTGVMHLLLIGSPRPWSFFRWIVGLLTIAVAALPFAAGVTTNEALVTSLLNLSVGAIIVGLVQSAAQGSVHRTERVRRTT